MANSVAVVIVTYNRKEKLLQCIRSLVNQDLSPDAVFIIDNASTDGTNCDLVSNYFSELLRDGEFIKGINFSYHRLDVNTGGAGGFSIGVEMAYCRGYDWIWVMDDDAAPDTSCLSELKKFFDNKYSFVAPRIVNKTTGEGEYYHHKTNISLALAKEINLDHEDISGRNVHLAANAFVGPLINRNAIEQLGKFPDPTFFIWWDDTDYTYSLTKCYGPGVVIGSSIIYHDDPPRDLDAAPIFDWKFLFGMRNRTRFFRKHATPITMFVLLLKSIKLYMSLKNYYKKDILKKTLFIELIRDNPLSIEEAKSACISA